LILKKVEWTGPESIPIMCLFSISYNISDVAISEFSTIILQLLIPNDLCKRYNLLMRNPRMILVFGE